MCHIISSRTTFRQVDIRFNFPLHIVYFNIGLFVVVSWISFVVPPEVIPGRMALLVTLFLVLVNIFNTVTTNTPKAEGIYNFIQAMALYIFPGLTAIEMWMLSCILFVFGALIGSYYQYKL